jgi:K+/H+ antiporter YhaU regulatory subunit KhtT
MTRQIAPRRVWYGSCGATADREDVMPISTSAAAAATYRQKLCSPRAVVEVVRDLPHELKIEELAVAPSAFAAGITLRDSGLREHAGLIVIAVKKTTGEMVFNPGAETRIEAGDRLVVMGQQSSLHELERRLSQSEAV